MEEDLLLVHRVLSGEQLAFRSIVEKYQNYVFTIAMRVLNAREEAEEVAQNVLNLYHPVQANADLLPKGGCAGFWCIGGRIWIGLFELVFCQQAIYAGAV